MKKKGRTRAVVRRGVEQSRRAAERSRLAVRHVRHWSGTFRGRLTIGSGVVAMLLLFLFALIGLPQIFRGPTVQSFTGPVGADPAALARAAGTVTGVRLVPGTRVEVLDNGDALFPRLWADLRAATRSIDIVQYYWGVGAVLDTTARILAERARAGVAVHIVYDAFGAGDLPTEVFDSLRASGIRAAEFRPLRWYALDRATHRTHVRAVVIDGQTGYTGGFGIDDKWLGNGVSPGQWRDTNVRITGPAVQQLLAVTVSHWAEATGELLAGHAAAVQESATDTEPEPGAAFAAIIHSPASVGSSRAERLLALSLAVARRRLWVTNAYFVPDGDYVRLLVEAAGRGVDVRVLTNGGGTDVKTTWYAGRHRYERLLEAGVRIFEYTPTVLHSKTLLGDDAWVEIGTVNFDNRSLAYNDEVALVVIDAGLGARMDSVFRVDAGNAREIRLEEFRRRSTLQRLLEWGSSLFAALL